MQWSGCVKVLAAAAAWAILFSFAAETSTFWHLCLSLKLPPRSGAKSSVAAAATVVILMPCAAERHKLHWTACIKVAMAVWLGKTQTQAERVKRSQRRQRAEKIGGEELRRGAQR